jgi:hypothetical protein
MDKDYDDRKDYKCQMIIPKTKFVIEITRDEDV